MPATNKGTTPEKREIQKLMLELDTHMHKQQKVTQNRSMT